MIHLCLSVFKKIKMSYKKKYAKKLRSCGLIANESTLS